MYDPNTVRIPFGRHRGTLIADLPTSYLRWMLRDVDHLDPPLREAATEELRRRVSGRHAPPPPPPPRNDRDGGTGGTGSGSPHVGAALRLVDTVVTSWYRRLSLKYHPDRGRDPVAMKIVNEAVELLREMMGAA